MSTTSWHQLDQLFDDEAEEFSEYEDLTEKEYESKSEYEDLEAESEYSSPSDQSLLSDSTLPDIIINKSLTLPRYHIIDDDDEEEEEEDEEDESTNILPSLDCFERAASVLEQNPQQMTTSSYRQASRFPVCSCCCHAAKKQLR